MNEFETTLPIMMLNHISYDDLAKQMGRINGGNLYNALNKNKNIYVSSLSKILNNLGYDLVIRKQGQTEGGYIIDNDSTPSPLRFHDMSMEFGIDPKKKRLNLSRSERLEQTEELKRHISEITHFECEERLREIWSTVSPVRKKDSKISEYESEYLKYRKEFQELYGEKLLVEEKKTAQLGDCPTKCRKGKIITEDSSDVKDMSEESVLKRQDEATKSRRDYLMSLTADFIMED